MNPPNQNPPNDPSPSDAVLAAVKFDVHGLVPAIAQDALTGEIRMMAYMNREAFERTVATREATFYSRSRNAMWKKGETSGNTLAVRSIHLDCDGDCVLLAVEPAGPSCHTGAESCFFRALAPDASDWIDGGRALPFAGRLEAELALRRASSASKSYTRKLLDGGAALVGAKLREEADELARAVDHEPDARVTSEAADVVFHLFAALLLRDRSWREVLAELARRFGTSGIDEKAARPTSKPG